MLRDAGAKAAGVPRGDGGQSVRPSLDLLPKWKFTAVSLTALETHTCLLHERTYTPQCAKDWLGIPWQ